jgi:hypothetical protein
VYGDITRAVTDFAQRKKENDPLLEGKTRVLVFNNKGAGPCRQGQYVESHKLLAYQEFGGAKITVESDLKQRSAQDDALLQFLVAEEKNGFSSGGMPEWVVIRAVQGVILQGVLHALLFDGAARCSSYEDYLRFITEYRALKDELYTIQESSLAPGKVGITLARWFGNVHKIGMPLKYLAYRFHNRDLHKVLARFKQRWNIGSPASQERKLRVYIEGEAYMRAAQAEEIFRLLLATLGFNRFQLHYSPVWIYLAYLVEEERHRHELQLSRAKQTLHSGSPEKQIKARETVSASLHAIATMEGLRFVINDLLAKPLYEAAGVAMPEPVESMLHAAREIIPTLRPAGELAPYVGEALNQLRHGVDLFLNVAPEGCMVASMGEVLAPKLIAASGQKSARMQNLFSSDGDVDEELLTVALLKSLGPQGYYSRSMVSAS